MIESGSHTPGVRAEDFDLPAHTALRYERPASALADLLFGYAVLDSDPVDPAGTSEWMLPTWPQIWIVMTDGPITVGIGNRRYAPLSSAILYGTTSRAMPVTAQGGVTVCIDLTPLGWARWIKAPADQLRDRITPLAEVMPLALVEDLVGALHASDRGRDVKAVVDAVFTRHLSAPGPDEAVVGRLMHAIADAGDSDVPGLAADLGVDVRALRRLAHRYFGFPPKLLMMRARFLDAFVPQLLAGDPGATGAAPAGYHNIPHYLRDAQRFLGTTPRRFLGLDVPYLKATLRARRLVRPGPGDAVDTGDAHLDRRRVASPPLPGDPRFAAASAPLEA